MTIFVRQRASTNFSDIDIYAGAQILIVLTLGFMLLINRPFLCTGPKIWGASSKNLIIYYLVCAISTIWSPFPIYTLYHSFEFLILLLSVFVALSSSLNFYEAEKTSLRISFLVLVFGLVMHLKLVGFSTSLLDWHTNSYSASGAMIFCYCLGEFFSAESSRKKRLRRYGLFGLLAVVLGTSSASNIATGIGIMILTIINGQFILMALIGFSILYFKLFGDSIFEAVRPFLFPGKTHESIEGMTGRVNMWKYLWQVFLQSPLYGNGFAVLPAGPNQVFKSNPHNSFFSIILGTGILGLIPVFFYVLKTSLEMIRTLTYKIPGSKGCTAAIVTGGVNSMSMPLVFDQWTSSTTVFATFLALFILFVLQHFKKESETHLRESQNSSSQADRSFH